MPKLRHKVDPRQQNQKAEISFMEQPVVAEFVQTIRDGGRNPERREIFCFGTRGDGKTIGWMVGAIEHARAHHAAGFPLPVPWVGVTDTFTSHKLKTIKSFENVIFKGGWRLSDNDHVATFYLAGTPLVRVDLFGIEDQGAMDRMRMETVGIWFEEPAPSAVMVTSSGVSEDAWNLGLTSQSSGRIPSHFYPAVTTENYPDEDHWTWQRANPTYDPVFAHPEQFRQIFNKMKIPWPSVFNDYPQGSPLEMCMGVSTTVKNAQWFRVPAGERASETDRLGWVDSLANRPDLVRRLILGQPGVIMMGDQVAQGFTRHDHTSSEIIPCLPGEPVYMGFDFGHTPSCTIAQYLDKSLRVKAGLFIKGAGQKQLLEEMILPWLGRFAPWVLRDPDTFAFIGFDPAQGTTEKPKGSEADIENSALKMIQDMLGGGWFEPGPIQWEVRKDILVRSFDRRRFIIVEDGPYTKDLIRALDGRWYYAKTAQGDLRSAQPKKPSIFADLGDSFIYMLSRYGVPGMNENASRPLRILTNLGEDDRQPNSFR